MRRYLALLMVMLFVGTSLISCQSNDSETNENETTTETEFVSSSETLETPIDLEGKLYFTCKNIDSDIYIGNTIMPKQKFSIISLEPIDLKEVEIAIPIQTEYTVKAKTIHDELGLYMTEYLAEEEYLKNPNASIYEGYLFPFYLYQCYRGIDWKLMKTLYEEAQEADEKIMELISTPFEPEYIEARETVARYEEYKNLYLEDYEKLTAEDLPQMYIYEFDIGFGKQAVSYDENGFVKESQKSENVVSESFNTIDITIGDTCYKQDIGEIRIHSEAYPEEFLLYLTMNSDAFVSIGGVPIYIDSVPWGDGKLLCRDVFSFQAKKDVTIDEIYFYNQAEVQILGAHVTIGDENPKYSSKGKMDFYWNLEEPLDIDEGKYVIIDLILEDSNMTQLEYATRMIPIMKCTVGTETNVYQTELNLDRLASSWNGYWLRYASVFGGLEEELESYFDDYYRPLNETWREEMPW